MAEANSRRPVPRFDGIEGILLRNGLPFGGESSGQDLGHPGQTGRTIVEQGVMKFGEQSVDGELERCDGGVEDTEAFGEAVLPGGCDHARGGLDCVGWDDAPAAVPVKAPDALFQPIRRERQVEVNGLIGELEVPSFLG